jgi:hypothetical protein
MVVIELAGDAPLPRDLAAGGVFVPDCALRLAEECDLVVCGTSHQLMIPARVVYVDPRGGAGLELLGFSPEMKAQLVELVTLASASVELPAPVLDDDPRPEAEAPGDDLEVPGWDDALELEPPPVIRAEDDGDSDDDLAIPLSDEEASAAAILAEPVTRAGDAVFAYAKPGIAYRGGVARRAGSETDDAGADAAGALGAELELGIGDFADAEPEDAGAADDQALELDLIGLVGDEADSAEVDGAEADGDEADGAPGANGRSKRGSRARFARNVNERLRGLTLAAQIKMATQGELHERIVLERLYGKNVWEALLRNQRLTAPEVARIARFGSLPRILIEIIVGNNAWLQIPEVRRALLSNPRLGVDQIMKVLRLTPKHELKLAAIQTAYPHAVRNAAKILMRGEP